MIEQGNLEADLSAETLKWLLKAEDLLCKITGNEPFLENISAYIHDCHYFMDKGDLIRAFESVIWAWAWMEIGLNMKLLEMADDM